MGVAPPIRQMIRQATSALDEPFSNAAIRDWVVQRWPETNRGSIDADIITCTVNQQSRVQYTQNQAPRVAEDERYDLLYRVDRGRRVVYDPEVHGAWRIARTPAGDLVVVCDDVPPGVEDAPAPAAARPITQAQIDAANRLRGLLVGWAATEEAFDRLREQHPGFDLPSCLLKAAAINDLYSTRVYAVWRMAKHITEVAGELPDDPVEAVQVIGRLPDGGGGTRRSFASKFGHFFIDPNRFPIFDSYCERMVALHLGTEELVRDGTNPYRAFKANIDRLRELSGIDATYRELDRYLWLTGQYREWLDKGDEAQINSELRQLFEGPSPEAARALKALLG